MQELERLKERAPIIKRLAEQGFFSEKEVMVLRSLGLLQGVSSGAQRE